MACELQFAKPREHQANLNQGTVYEKKLPGLFKNVNFVKYQEGLRSCSRLKDPKEIQWLGVTHDLEFSFAELVVSLTIGEITMRSMG